MPKCENCIHCEVCKRYLMSTDITPEELNKIGKREQTKQCEFFKDKSLIVELLCKVGDDLYWISDENKVECQKNAIIGVVVKNDGFEVLDTDGNRDKLGTRFAYLTREEAEKALRERGKSG